MNPPVDTSAFQLGVPPDEDPDEEAPLLDALAKEARAFVPSFRWAPPVAEMLLAFGVGKIIGLFLVRFVHGIAGGGHGDTETWVVVGDLPSIYFETEDIRTPADALEAYCRIAEGWADQVLAGGDLSECYPVKAPPTRENAEMLKGRIGFIREELIPRA
jgi:hypothetical protein